MAPFVALLRGINVSGKNTIRMVDLKALFKDLGYQNVTTYLQSGNVVFETKPEGISCKEHSRISQAIITEFGYEVPVLILPGNHLAKTINENPYRGSDASDTNSLYVTFLFSEPESILRNNIVVPKNESGVFKIVRQNVYILCSNGYGKTKINNQYFEKKLRVLATTRNWKTICALESLIRLIRPE